MIKPTQQIKNERGALTIDFLFAFTLIFGFTLIFFALALTLTVVEVGQYITFAAARTMSAAHFDKTRQEEAGAAKFDELVAVEVFAPLFSNGWYEFTDPIVGQVSDTVGAYKEPKTDKFYGVAARFTARILDMNIPFFGSTAPDSDGTGSGFKTLIGSYLGREPTTMECLTFSNKRWSQIRQLKNSGAAPYTTSTTDTGYYVYADNGC